VSLSAELRRAWSAADGYLSEGFSVARIQPWLYVKLVFLYSLPAIAAAWLVLYAPHEASWYEPLQLPLPWGFIGIGPAFVLPWITVAVAPVVVMLAVHAGRHGEQLSVREATRRGIPLVPKYLWTNVHTTAMFWIPVGGLVLLRDGTALGEAIPSALWYVVIGLVAIHQHVRTMMAPYLAIHGDQNGTRAAIGSWQMGGEHFWTLLWTFVRGIIPSGLPLVAVLFLAEQFGPSWVQSALVAASAQISWVTIQAVRPVLIPALHTLYEDLAGQTQVPLAR
jgi:hypothetical protein